MTFKEQIARDNQTIFLNTNEFSDMHTINGKEMAVQIDNNEMLERETRYKNKGSLYGDGVYRKELMLYVLAEDFGPLPAVGRVVTVDHKSYIVTDAINEDGIYSISMEANRT